MDFQVVTVCVIICQYIIHLYFPAFVDKQPQEQLIIIIIIIYFVILFT